MSFEQLSAAMRRHWKIFAITFVVCMAVVAVVTALLPKTYTATATLNLGLPNTVGTDTALAEQLSRTYATLASNANVADVTRQRLPGRPSRSELLSRMSLAPVERTTLIQISADGSTPGEAQLTANTYARVFTERAARELPRATLRPSIALSEPAARPTSPSKPKPALYLGLGAVIAGILALLAVLWRDRADQRLRVTAGDDRLLGVEILGGVPAMTGRSAAEAMMAADAFQLLLTNIDLADERPPCVVLVTSSSPDEGKSTVSAGLGRASAVVGERTLVVEADLRRPGLARTWLSQVVPFSNRGLTEVLTYNVALTSVIQQSPEIPGLAVLWSGAVDHTSVHLLKQEDIVRILADLRRTYDRIIIDSPPVAVGADASNLAGVVDGSVCVVDLATATEASVRSGLKQLRHTRRPLLGVVLNNVKGTTGYAYYLPEDEPQPTRTR